MKKLARYLELIVDPTFDDFHVNRGSIRLAFLTSVTIYHSIDRVAEETGKRAARLRQLWCKESTEFKIVDGLAHHFKHVESNAETHPRGPGIPIAHALGFGPNGLNLERRNLYFVLRDAIGFLRTKAQARAATK